MINKLKKHKSYSDNPILWLKDSLSYILPTYLWIMWLIITLIIIVGYMYGLVSLSQYVPINFGQLSLPLLLILPVVAYLQHKIYTEEELVLLLNNENMLLGLFAPYVFTAILLLLLGIFSIWLPVFNDNLKLILYLLTMLCGFSMFNIFYAFINDIYFSISRLSQFKFAEQITQPEANDKDTTEPTSDEGVLTDDEHSI